MPGALPHAEPSWLREDEAQQLVGQMSNSCCHLPSHSHTPSTPDPRAVAPDASHTWLSAREDRLCYQLQMTQGGQLASVWQALCAPTDSRPTVLTQLLGPVGKSVHCSHAGLGSDLLLCDNGLGCHCPHVCSHSSL